MNLVHVHHHRPPLLSFYHTTPHRPILPPPRFYPLPGIPFQPPTIPPMSVRTRYFNFLGVAKVQRAFSRNEFKHQETELNLNDLDKNGAVYKKTLRLVECAMFAAVSGLAYFLSNSLAIENYFGCFFALPIVISSLRWGVAAGRKLWFVVLDHFHYSSKAFDSYCKLNVLASGFSRTWFLSMTATTINQFCGVATAMLLLVLSGPVKALTYVLMHGLVGFAMGSLWRLETDWTLSIILSTLVRTTGACGNVIILSFLIRENKFALITRNLHASLTYMFTAIGLNTIPSMGAIYTIFGILVVLNCGFFVFLLHIFYALLLTRLGMKSSSTLPRWLRKTI